MKLADLKVTEFVDLLASDAPAPGGGSAAALEGALGAALTAMVCELTTIGKKPEAPAAPTTKKCPFCKSDIAIDATRCPHCTSQLEA